MSHEADLLRMLEPAVRPTGAPAPSRAPRTPVEQRGFDELLADVQRGSLSGEPQALRFSAHAQDRLIERGVQLSDAQLDALSRAAEQAEAKGAVDSLMLMNGLGMIVNIPNRTVLTVLPQDRMQSGVITQIDSAVLVADAPAQTLTGHRLNL